MRVFCMAPLRSSASIWWNMHRFFLPVYFVWQMTIPESLWYEMGDDFSVYNSPIKHLHAHHSPNITIQVLWRHLSSPRQSFFTGETSSYGALGSPDRHSSGRHWRLGAENDMCHGQVTSITCSYVYYIYIYIYIYNIECIQFVKMVWTNSVNMLCNGLW